MSTPTTPPHLFVVLGATGDLMMRKLLPSLHKLYQKGEIVSPSVILGAARKPISEDQFRALGLQHLVEEKAGTTEGLEPWCREVLHYQCLGEGGPEDYQRLAERIRQIEAARGLPGNRVLYLALPLGALHPAMEGLGSAGLSRGPGWTRLVVEKPFGRDLASAESLNRDIHQSFKEEQVYRIDHYLGKETVQNLLVFRFANLFIESLWNRQWVEHVQITVSESLGVEGRAEYYDTAGAMRDMVQNHLTQLLTLIAMEVPGAFEADAIRNEKVKVLRSVERPGPSDVVFGQYTSGKVDGKDVAGYREEPGVRADSTTETYAAIRLRVASWRWHGDPFFLRTGKRLPRKSTRITVTFKAPPISFFQLSEEYEVNPDRLSIILQPDEGFDLAFEIKVPGEATRTQTHRMKFRYSDVFGEIRDAYETLLLDVLSGDQTLFVRADEVEESWRLYDAILSHPPPVHKYSPGSAGPAESSQLTGELGYRWNDL